MTRLAAALALTAALATAQAHAADPVRGRHLAIEACAACHKVVARQAQPAPVVDPDSKDSVLAPTFFIIARKFAPAAAGLRAFILAPTHPMREQTFAPRDISDIVAYIRSLRRTARRF